MYTNVAYLNNSVSVVKDTSKPLIVTSCGFYRVDSGPMLLAFITHYILVDYSQNILECLPLNTKHYIRKNSSNK